MILCFCHLYYSVMLQVHVLNYKKTKSKTAIPIDKQTCNIKDRPHAHNAFTVQALPKKRKKNLKVTSERNKTTM